jgi:hypothetical protein
VERISTACKRAYDSKAAHLVGRVRRFDAGALLQDALRDQAADVRDKLWQE